MQGNHWGNTASADSESPTNITRSPGTTKDQHSATLSDWLLTKQSQQRLQIGVSFRDLNCHGFLTSTQYQPTLFSTVAGIFKRLRRQQQRIQILHGFDGLIQPGEMLLVLGRPGSGCSSFLKALAGETHGFHLDKDTSINYQVKLDGSSSTSLSTTSTDEAWTKIAYQQMHRDLPGERVYLAELDVHFPELTLGQTLDFAASTRRGAGTNKKGMREITDSSTGRTMASLFALTQAFDTPVGDAVIRGISGGEKRRTSIAEAYVGGAQLQCWDNSTRGLDSSTARRFIELLRESTDALQSTVAMSLYQASEGMYKCFDKVMVLYEGRQIYFGPIDLAADYFTALGFMRSSRSTTPDFLTSLTNSAERIIRDGWEDRVPRSPDDFANAWARSDIAKALRAAIDVFDSSYPQDGIHGAREKLDTVGKLRLRTSTFPLLIYEQVLVCLQRSVERLCNNYVPVVSALVANSILGIIVGSVFYNLGESTNDLRQRSILLFFATMLNSFVPAFEVDLMWAQRPIVEKQYRYAFYHPFVERLASMICDLPAKFALSFWLHIPIYFMTNLRRTATSFFTYWCFMLVNLLTMAMLFRMIGSVSKSRDGTMTPVSILTLLCVLYAGYVVPPPYMVPWLGWFRYINPVAYTYESVMINEFRGRQFTCSSLVPDGPSYTNIEQSLKQCSEIGRNVQTGLVDGTTYLALKYGYTSGHLWRNLGILLAMMVAFCATHLLAAEYIPAEKSRGEVLRFKRKATEKDYLRQSTTEKDDERQATQDDEAGNPPIFAQDVSSHKRSDGNKDCSISRSATVVSASHHAPVFHWDGVAYDVKSAGGTRSILKGIDGWLQPGSFTVLMGATGAGKTTLLDVLADQTSAGRVSGNVFIDGQPRNATGNFRRRMGYVQQNDIHLPTTTVREALQFSALLRQPREKSKEEKFAYVETVLEMLDMEAYADAIVGVPGEGLNVEQRKRLSIAVEMVAKPDLVLFLDEPTSGLDSQTAWSICMLLRKLVDNNHTILCTVHQPSAQLFSMFDRLLLLQDGATIYFGEIGRDASLLTKYFETQGARKCRADENPAEWMLDVTAEQPISSANSQTWPAKWQSSQERHRIVQQVKHLEQSRLLTSTKASERIYQEQGEFAAPLSQQVLILMKRGFQDQWRDPTYLYTKTAVCIGLSFFNGISFFHADHDIQGLTNLLLSIFLVSQLFSILSMLIIPRFTHGRDVFEARERNSKTYSWVALVTANIVVEITWLTPISACLFVCWYFPTDMYRDGTIAFGPSGRSGLAFLLVWLFCLWASTLSQAFAAGIGNPETAIQIATLCFWLTLVFCGILVPPTSLPGFWIFMYRVSPLSYFLEGLAIAGIAGTSVTCSAIEMLQVTLPPNTGTCDQYMAAYIHTAGGYIDTGDETNGYCQYCPVSDADTVLRSLGMGTTSRRAWRNMGLMAGYVVFDILAIFCIYWLARVPRKRK